MFEEEEDWEDFDDEDDEDDQDNCIEFLNSKERKRIEKQVISN